jgi:hypothetical protein
MMIAGPLHGYLLHAVLEGQLSFLDCGFFELFGFREVGFVDELVQAIVQGVVPFGQIPVLIVALQQEVLYFLRFRSVHGRTLLSGTYDSICHAQGNTDVK